MRLSFVGPLVSAVLACYGTEELARQAVLENPQIINPSCECHDLPAMRGGQCIAPALRTVRATHAQVASRRWISLSHASSRAVNDAAAHRAFRR